MAVIWSAVPRHRLLALSPVEGDMSRSDGVVVVVAICTLLRQSTTDSPILAADLNEGIRRRITQFVLISAVIRQFVD